MVGRGLRWGAVLGLLLLGSVLLRPVRAQGPFSAQIQSALRAFGVQANSWTGVQTFAGGIDLAASAYANWGATLGSGGYGLRDNAGTIEFKDTGGAWAPIASAASGGGWQRIGTVVSLVTGTDTIGSSLRPTDATYTWGDSTHGWLSGFIKTTTNGDGTQGLFFKDNAGPVVGMYPYGDGSFEIDLGAAGVGGSLYLGYGDAFYVNEAAVFSSTLLVSGLTTATGGFSGDLTGNVTGNLTGNVTGNLIGNISGDTTVTGDLTVNGDGFFGVYALGGTYRFGGQNTGTPETAPLVDARIRSSLITGVVGGTLADSYIGIHSSLIFGAGGVAQKGTGLAYNSDLIVEGAGDASNEYAYLLGGVNVKIGAGYTQVAGPVGNIWGADLAIQGPIGLQPPLLNGITHVLNNYYNGSPSGGASGAFWAVSQQGKGGNIDATHAAANTYPVDVGFGCVGAATSGTQYGFTTCYQAGGAGGSGWLIATSKIGTGYHARDYAVAGFLADNAAGSGLDFSGTGTSKLTNLQLGAGVLAFSGTAPTIASGGCTSPAITNHNGTAKFTVTIGTSCTGVKAVTLTLPATTTSWQCDAVDLTTPASFVPVATGTSTTAVVLTNYARTTGLTIDYVASEVLSVKCIGG